MATKPQDRNQALEKLESAREQLESAKMDRESATREIEVRLGCWNDRFRLT
jgi:hypothetical protein